MIYELVLNDNQINVLKKACLVFSQVSKGKFENLVDVPVLHPDVDRIEFYSALCSLNSFVLPDSSDSVILPITEAETIANKVNKAIDECDKALDCLKIQLA